MSVWWWRENGEDRATVRSHLTVERVKGEVFKEKVVRREDWMEKGRVERQGKE
jgi:hypothetical protein